MSKRWHAATRCNRVAACSFPQSLQELESADVFAEGDGLGPQLLAAGRHLLAAGGRLLVHVGDALDRLGDVVSADGLGVGRVGNFADLLGRRFDGIEDLLERAAGLLAQFRPLLDPGARLLNQR
ncbi:MAG: hypothetical protein ABFD16_18860, partial [Thermoguttaceae bacterium]